MKTPTSQKLQIQDSRFQTSTNIKISNIMNLDLFGDSDLFFVI